MLTSEQKNLNSSDLEAVYKEQSLLCAKKMTQLLHERCSFKSFITVLAVLREILPDNLISGLGINYYQNDQVSKYREALDNGYLLEHASKGQGKKLSTEAKDFILECFSKYSAPLPHEKK